jgi:hypothetical protein
VYSFDLIKFCLSFEHDTIAFSQSLCIFIILYYLTLTASVVLWSEFLATDPEARVRFPALPEKKVVALERGPLSLVSTSEELLDRNVAAPV